MSKIATQFTPTRRDFHSQRRTGIWRDCDCNRAACAGCRAARPPAERADDLFGSVSR